MGKFFEIYAGTALLLVSGLTVYQTANLKIRLSLSINLILSIFHKHQLEKLCVKLHLRSFGNKYLKDP